jgi:hypothetical protein
MAQAAIKLRLSARERELVFKYGYPFQELKEQLAKYEYTTGSATVTIDSFFLDCLLADLVRSAKQLTDARLLDEIDALYTRLESQAHTRGYRAV